MRSYIPPEDERVMSNTNRNFIIAYVILVGLPIVGLAGALKSGHTLTAPISVDGVWTLQLDPVQLAAQPCTKSLVSVQDAPLAISQSGKNFTFNFSNEPKSIGAGKIEGTKLTASLIRPDLWTSQAGCSSGRELSIVATVDGKSDSRSLSGTLSFNDCPSCATVQFHGIRQAPLVKGGR
jgi:hypothetical protein